MNIPFSPQLLEMAMARLGIAASQLKSIDTGAKKAMFRFMIGAVQSGDANSYIKESFAHLDEWRAEKEAATAPPPPRPPQSQPAPSYRATSRPITEPKR